MGYYRMYTGDDGAAQWEEVDLQNMSCWQEGVDVTKAKFEYRPPGVFQDWHPAPQRQFVVILSGNIEIGFEDGSKKTFGPTDVRLVEDTTGKGHTTIALGSEPCITMTVRLEDQGDE